MASDAANSQGSLAELHRQKTVEQNMSEALVLLHCFLKMAGICLMSPLIYAFYLSIIMESSDFPVSVSGRLSTVLTAH